MTAAAQPCPPIGVFDSGVGGLSVLRALLAEQPGCDLHYVADSGHAPYGERDAPHVIERSLRIAAHLSGHGARMIIVACNTATALAIDTLRRQFPAVAWVGVEPGIKPAAAASRNGRIGVMATAATLTSARFAALVQRHAPHCHIVPQPCPGLAAAIERGAGAQAEINALLDRFCAPLVTAGVDTVVLGCTHYPFAAGAIAKRLGPGVQLLDTAQAVARQAVRLWQTRYGAPPAAAAPPALRLQTTGKAAVLERLAHTGLGLDLRAQILQL